MPIQVTCDQCGRQLTAKDEYAGRRTQCPDCGKELVIPMPGPGAGFDEEVGPAKGYVGEPTTSGKAITSLVLGILSMLGCCLLTGIPALIFGILGLNEAKRSGGRVKGEGLAVGGIVTGSLGSLGSIVAVLIALLLPAVQAAREAARRAQCTNNMKQITLALHNFHSAEGHLPPPAIVDKDGKPLLSWRVAILPYIEQKALYDQFHLDEPWDSPHNLSVASRIPLTYRCPSDPGEPGEPGSTETGYLAVVGPGALFDPERLVSFQDVTDGTSNTIAVVESSKRVPWTKPEDIDFGPGAPPPPLGSRHPGGFNAAFADGSIRFIKLPSGQALFPSLATRAGGEIIPPF